jgi:hypothetical protein
MERRKRRFLFYAFLLSAAGLFSQAIGPDTPPAIPPGTPPAGQQSAELWQTPPAPIPLDLAKNLREISARLRSEAAGWRTDSAELLQLVEELQASLSEAEAERTSLTQSLDSLKAWREQSSAAHAQEIAAIRSALEAEIARIEGERIQAHKAAEIWKAAAFIGVGAGLGTFLGSTLGFFLGGISGTFLFLSQK